MYASLGEADSRIHDDLISRNPRLLRTIDPNGELRGHNQAVDAFAVLRQSGQILPDDLVAAARRQEDLVHP